ncbi:hypothetical protein DPMN_178189 [Dreissena polymorpha]|uniref:Uncharacterized protein n=1 Tax=Dreissena polymorpha TaxID=45954 RepID=A0A9D4EAE8_DREPO|nr:hypothetical protein DPMN_178189 [Dreissena polymorpha]
MKLCLIAQNIIETNHLTNFHEDQKINEKCPTPVSHVFQPTSIIFELFQDIMGMNLLTKFHEDQTVNVASRVLTRFYYGHIRKNAPPLGSHVFQANIIIFELNQDIIATNLLTKFHEDWTINVVSRVLTRKNAPPLISHVFQANVTIFELIQDIIETNLLTKFYEDRKINAASRELTGKNAPPPGGHFHEDWTINVASSVKNAPLLGSHVFQAKFPENRKINVASRVLTRFYYSHIKKNAPPPGGHVFQPTGIIFEHIQDIIGMNLLTKFHEDQTINVASREKNAPPHGSNVFQANVTIFELNQDIIETNLQTINHSNFMKIGQ